MDKKTSKQRAWIRQSERDDKYPYDRGYRLNMFRL